MKSAGSSELKDEGRAMIQGAEKAETKSLLLLTYGPRPWAQLSQNCRDG